MKEKIKELRAMLPIPLMEAKQMLEANEGDVEACVYLYMAKAIDEIAKATGCDKEKAEKHYRAENFDINRAISVINDEIYDLNYQPIAGVNRTNLQFVKDWIYLVETENFSYALAYPHLSKAVDTLMLIPKLKDLGVLMNVVRLNYDEIFKNYNDSQPLEEFVRLNRLLDDVSEFQEANVQIPLQILYIKNEISRHWRNVK